MEQQTTFQDRYVKERERAFLTQVSRSQAWKLEQIGKYPKRIRISTNSVVWRLSSLIRWMEERG